MFAFQACPSALLADHSASRRPVPLAARTPRLANSAHLHVQAQRSSSAPGTERISSPLYFQQVVHSSSRAKRYNHLLFSSFNTLSRTRKNLTPLVSSTSTLFVRSFSQEGNSTPLLSNACGLFCGYVGVRETKYKALLSTRSGEYPSKRKCPRGEPRRSLGEGPCLTRRSTVDVRRQWCYTPTRLQIVTEEKKCVDLPI